MPPTRTGHENRGGSGRPVYGSDEARIDELRRVAARHREAARELHALARACRSRADQIMFEEFGRREIDACRRLERCVDRHRATKSSVSPGRGGR